MNILGINSYFEHPSVALISNGELVFAMEDERFTRIKHGKSYTPYKTSFPIDSIYAALNFHGITLADIKEIAYSYNKWIHLKSLWGCFTGHRMSSINEEIAAFRSVSNLKNAMCGGYEIPRSYRHIMNPKDFYHINIHEWNHHISHAASAFFCSGFDEALVFVIDGSGERACSSVYLGKGKYLKKIREISLPHSLGFFYSAITEHLGFEPFSDEYKVMGLAAYGENRYKDKLKSVINLSEDGGYKINIRLLKNLTLVLGPKRSYGAPIEQMHKDIAKSAQLCLEEAIEEFVKHAIKQTKINNICVAGGTFLNILVNARLAALKDVKSIFVQPAAHDAGTAIGSAALSAIKYGSGQTVEVFVYVLRNTI